MNLGHAYENSSSNTPASPNTMRCRFSPYLEQGICKVDQCTKPAALHWSSRTQSAKVLQNIG